MPNLITQVDNTSVNYEESFAYTINASFNGIEGEIESAEMNIFFPDTIQVFIGDVSGPIKSVEIENVTGGRNVKYTFDEIKNLGAAVRVGLGGLFEVNAEPPQSYAAEAILTINTRLEDGTLQTETLTSTAETVTLDATKDFKITRDVVLPTIDPAAGGEVYYRVQIENVEDKGVRADELIVTIPSVEGITFDTTYRVAGKDISDARFQDTSQDTVMPEFNDGTLTFRMGTYKGHKYEFYYKALLASDLGREDEVVTEADLEVDGIQKDPDTNTITIGESIEEAEIGLYGPDFTLIDDWVNYEVYIHNTGNQKLEDVVLIEELPDDRVQYTEIETGSFKYNGIDQKIPDSEIYEIRFRTENGVPGVLGPYQANTNTKIILADEIPEIAAGDNLDVLEWHFNGMDLGVGVIQQDPPQIIGQVKQDIALNPPILNEVRVQWKGQEEGGDDSVSTRIQDSVVLQPTFRQITEKNYFNVGEEIELSMGLNARRSRIKNPILITILPKQLEYVDKSMNVTYKDYFKEDVDLPITPSVALLENFDGQGRSAVRLTYQYASSYDFNQKAEINARFKVRVKEGAERGPIELFSLLNTTENNGEYLPDEPIYRDDYNIAGDTDVYPRYAESRTIEGLILFSVSADSDKKVKGQLDTVFTEEPEQGRTVNGGDAEYELFIRNTGTTDYTTLDIVDILPHVGDTGVVETTSPRKSEFAVYLKNAITVTFDPPTPENEPTQAVEILYSKSYDPVRFGNNFNQIGEVDDWSTTIPKNLSEIKAFRIRTTEGTGLFRGQSVKVSFAATLPLGVEADKVAWNSFATEMHYYNLEGGLEKLLAIEPEKVGIRVEAREDDKGIIGGFVWLDEDEDGTFEEGTAGLNGYYVILADVNDENRVIAHTLTTSDTSGQPGYYVFNNIPQGDYIVRVHKDNLTQVYTKQRLDVPNGSRAEEKNGYMYVSVKEGDLEQLNWHTGLAKLDRMAYILKMNNSARSMMRNVIYDQMLIGMKYEDTIGIIDKK